jgi:hypothetical protein
MKQRRKSGEATLAVLKRTPDEDDLLSSIRDIHLRILALYERKDFSEWLLADDPDPNNQNFLRTVEELQAAERLFYELRAGRAVGIAQDAKDAALA